MIPNNDLAAHTPGPWSASEENCGGGMNIFAGKLRIGHTAEVSEINASRVGARPVTSDEAKANARVIAAAPDLLDAARTVLAGLVARIEAASATGSPVQIFDGISALDAAIRKASGPSCPRSSADGTGR
jgi:hypothetical protein